MQNGLPFAFTTRIHGTDFLALNHHLAMMGEQNKREFNTQQVVISSRWNPTPEQLQTLEELYRRGTRTPSSDQIQHITAQLRRYGKIEGKNVFYWFQNHKARERQKRRRQQLSHNYTTAAAHNEKKELSREADRTAFEVEQAYKFASPRSCSTTTISEKNISRQGTLGNKSDGWIQLNDETDLQEMTKNGCTNWQMMFFSPSVSNSAVPLMAVHDRNPHFTNVFSDESQLSSELGGGAAAAQTLQLFPLHSRDFNSGDEPAEVDEESCVAPTTISSLNVGSNYQFFEFLPLKN